jgi:hypothetical protein
MRVRGVTTHNHLNQIHPCLSKNLFKSKKKLLDKKWGAGDFATLTFIEAIKDLSILFD